MKISPFGRDFFFLSLLDVRRVLELNRVWCELVNNNVGNWSKKKSGSCLLYGNEKWKKWSVLSVMVEALGFIAFTHLSTIVHEHQCGKSFDEGTRTFSAEQIIKIWLMSWHSLAPRSILLTLHKLSTTVVIKNAWINLQTFVCVL